MKVISMFNHKGGVAKTTSTYSIAWEVANRGLRVLMVDFDPQCNLSQLVLQSTFEERDLDFEGYYAGVPIVDGANNVFIPPANPNNVRDVFLPIIEDLAQPIPVPQFYPVKQNLFLLAGHPQITAYEEKLSVAYSSSGSLATRSLVGFLDVLAHLRALNPQFDVVFLDLSPSIGALNRHLLLLSDYFIVPCAPDYFSFEAIRSLQRTIPEWGAKDRAMKVLALNLPQAWRAYRNVPRFVGVLLLRYTHRRQTPAKNFMKWIVSITVQVSGQAQVNANPRPVAVQLVAADPPAQPAGLIQALQLDPNNNMTFAAAQYNLIQPVPGQQHLPHYQPHNILGMISDFTQLAALSHIHSRPVNGLGDNHLTAHDPTTGDAVQQQGNRLQDLIIRRNEWVAVFSAVVDNISRVTNNFTL